MKTSTILVILIVFASRATCSNIESREDVFIETNVVDNQTRLREDDTHLVLLHLTTDQETRILNRGLLVNASIDDNSIASVDFEPIIITKIDRDTNISIFILGKNFGRTFLRWSLLDQMDESVVLSGVIPVAVLRKEESYQLAFTIFVSILVTINNVNMGCFIDLNMIKRVLKTPIAPIIGFACQFLFMPLGSFFIGLLLFPENTAWRLGLFVLGCCPGGTGSNFWTLLFDGDIDLSVTMTFVSTIAAMGMMPLWIFTLGRQLLNDANVKIPYLNLVISLAFLSLSLGIGLLIQKYRPNWAKFLKKFLKPVTAIVIFIVITCGTYVSLYVFRMMTWTVIFAGFSVALGGYVAGGIVALVFGLPRKQVIAVSIETALQNPGIAFILLQLSLQQPDADLTAIPIVGQLFMTGIPLWITYLVYVIVRRIIRCCRHSEEENKEDEAKEVEELEKMAPVAV